MQIEELKRMRRAQAIVKRAVKLDLNRHPNHISLCMDIELSPINHARLLEFDDFNFTHDVLGIQQHLNRETLQFDDCFVPRCGLAD